MKGNVAGLRFKSHPLFVGGGDDDAGEWWNDEEEEEEEWRFEADDDEEWWGEYGDGRWCDSEVAV